MYFLFLHLIRIVVPCDIVLDITYDKIGYLFALGQFILKELIVDNEGKKIFKK